MDENWSWPLVGTVLRGGGEGVVGYEVHFLTHLAIGQATAAWEALEFVDGAGDELGMWRKADWCGEGNPFQRDG